MLRGSDRLALSVRPDCSALSLLCQTMGAPGVWLSSLGKKDRTNENPMVICTASAAWCTMACGASITSFRSSNYAFLHPFVCSIAFYFSSLPLLTTIRAPAQLSGPLSMTELDFSHRHTTFAGDCTKTICVEHIEDSADFRQSLFDIPIESHGFRSQDLNMQVESQSFSDKRIYLDLARRAASLTSNSSFAESVSEGRRILSEAVRVRMVPGLDDTGDATVDDCVAAYYLSQACKNLGQTNSQHYYWREALTLVESLVLRLRTRQSGSPELLRYEAAGCNPQEVLEDWARAVENEADTEPASASQPREIVW